MRASRNATTTPKVVAAPTVVEIAEPSAEATGETWKPLIKLDVLTCSAKAFEAAIEEFEGLRKDRPLPEIDQTNGWQVLTPPQLEALLEHNPVTGNRKVTLPTVRYYAEQMQKGYWKKTGQPIIIRLDGKLLDGGHRLWAAYLTNFTLETFVVGDVANDEGMFAYIDNSKPRSPADALKAAGFNGQAKAMQAVINMARYYDADCYTVDNKRLPLGKVGPMEYIEFAQAHPDLLASARHMAAEHAAATAMLGGQTVSYFVAFKILEHYGEAVLDDFMHELASTDGTEEISTPVAALQAVLENNAKLILKGSKRTPPLKQHIILGNVIAAFNAWKVGEEIKGKLVLNANAPFPKFEDIVEAEPLAEAAE